MPNNRPRVGTFWTRTFDAAKAADGWFVVERTYTKRTAKALACDIRSSHRRRRIDIAGLLPDDHWDAIWEAPANADDESWNCVVAIKYRGKRKQRWDRKRK